MAQSQRRAWQVIIALAVFAATGVCAAATDLRAIGERIYRDGVLPSGKPVRAVQANGTPMAPGFVACIGCHRRSAMGCMEGTMQVPPLIREVLGRPGVESVQAFGNNFRRLLQRPAYDDASLAKAIRHGIDPAGQPLVAPMPRYQLDGREMAALVAYLKSMARGQGPGVSDDEIHLATIVGEGVPEAAGRAMREVLQAYVDDRNAGSRTTSRQNADGDWIVTPRRRWRLHVWELSGPPAEWPGQLEAHYRRQPVFAVMGGIAAGSWQPIHEYCERRELPCYFPSTDQPGPDDGQYSLYLSAGVSLSAEALAQYLADNPPARPILQVYDNDASNLAAAAAFTAALARNGLPAPEDHRIGGALDAAFWEGVLRGDASRSVVVWLKRPDVGLLRPWLEQIERVVIPSPAAPELPAVPEGFAGKLMTVHPFVLPSQKEARFARLRAWLKAKGQGADQERVRSDAYFAAHATGTALAAIGENFSRDYFLEQLENLPEYLASMSLYPRVSFGPGQRYAAKGAHVLTLGADGVPTVNGWIVP
jgi:hypothetical protein